MSMKFVTGPKPKTVRTIVRKAPVKTTVIKNKPTKRFVQKILTEQGEVCK